MKAFISYSHEDADLLAKLLKHLAALNREGLLDAWTDKEIHAGGVIDDHVDAAMEDAQLFILLISASFIHSDYCFAKEFARALERHEAGEAIIVPIIVRECDWNIDALRKFKALPDDGKAIISRHWHSDDEAFAHVASGLRKLLSKDNAPLPRASKSKQKSSFIPDDRHVSEEQRDQLRRIHTEIVERLTAKTATLPDDEAKKKQGKWYGIVWSQFHEQFGTAENGLQSLPREKFDEAKTWLLQYRASKDKNLKRANPQRYRNSLTKAIYSNISELGWTKEQLYAFAAEKVGYALPIESLNDLGNNQLETVRDRVRYEMTKRTVKAKQSKAKRKTTFELPSLPAAKEILNLILSHPVAEQRGLSEILREVPGKPLEAAFIPNTTARGTAAIVKKSLLRPAIAELFRLGWVLPPEGNENIRIYELNPECQPLSTTPDHADHKD